MVSIYHPNYVVLKWHAYSRGYFDSRIKGSMIEWGPYCDEKLLWAPAEKAEEEKRLSCSGVMKKLFWLSLSHHCFIMWTFVSRVRLQDTSQITKKIISTTTSQRVEGSITTSISQQQVDCDNYITAKTTETNLLLNASDVFIAKPPELYRAIEGETVSFDCIPNKSFDFRQEWYTPSGIPLISGSAHMHKVMSGIFIHPDNTVLTIQRVRLVYAGDYQCSIFINGVVFLAPMKLQVVISHFPLLSKVVFTTVVFFLVILLLAICLIYIKMERARVLFYEERKQLKEQQTMLTTHF